MRKGEMSKPNVGPPRFQLNPAITNYFTSLVTGTSEVTSKVSASGIPWWIYPLALLILGLVIWFYLKTLFLVETPENIRSKLRKLVDTYNMYGNQRSLRKGLRQYLADLKKAGLPDEHLALTNFFVCSANTPAIFTPLTDGIVTPEAIRIALAAGARYLDISIYPSGPRGAPMVCEMNPGSNWRRITLNELSFAAVMTAVQQYAMSGPKAVVDVNEAPYREDPLFLMLRFQGAPKAETFKQVAAVLRDTIETSRLDFTYNAGRGADRLFKTPITEYFGKTIVFSNVYPPIDSPLNDYINVGPRSATPLEIAPRDLNGIPDQMKAQTMALIQQNLTVSRIPMEEPDCNSNTWDWTKAHALGIHFAAMNFWSQDDTLKAYRAPGVFGINSFLIKPAGMRFVIEYAAPPGQPDPKLNSGNGTPAAPPGLNIPVS